MYAHEIDAVDRFWIVPLSTNGPKWKKEIIKEQNN